MNITKINSYIDNAIRFLLFLMIFWLPYSKAMIEVSVIASSLLWLIKRSLGFYQLRVSRRAGGIRKDLVKAYAFRPSPVNPAVWLFLLCCIVSIFVSPLPAQSLIGFINKTMEWFAIYFLVLEVFVKRKHILIALGIFAVTTLATGIDAVLQYYLTGTDLFNRNALVDGYRVTAGFAHPNMLGAYLTVAVPVTLSLVLHRSAAFWQRGALVFLLLLSVLALLLTFSGGAWISVVMGVLFLGWRLFTKAARPWARAWFAVLGVLVMFFMVSGAYELKQEANINDRQAQTVVWRAELWKESLKVVRERPFFGHGLNTYMPLMSGFLKATQSPMAFGFSPSYAHNCYLQMMVEVGALGLAAFLWILCGLFFRVRATVGTLAAEDRDHEVLMLGILAGLLGFLAHSFVDTNFYTLQLPALFWYFAGLLISYDKLLTAKRP